MVLFFLECTAGRGSKGHERSEKNVPGARFGARVRVAARQRCERASSSAPKITTHSGGDFFRTLLGAHRRVSRLPPAVAARQPGHFLETASLHPPQAALRRFPRRGRVTSPTRSAGPRSKSGAGGQRKRGNTFSQSVFCHCKIQKHMLRLCKQEEGFL